MKVKTLKWLIDSIKNTHQDLRLACEWSVGEIKSDKELNKLVIGKNGVLQKDNGFMSIAEFSQVIDELPKEDLDKEIYFYK